MKIIETTCPGIRLLASIIVVLVVSVLTAAAASPAPTAANVGFSELQIPNGAEPPLQIGVWYPTEAQATIHDLGAAAQTVAVDAPIAGRQLPLVVLSHGGGGSFRSHYDTALALACAGFVAAAVSHAGDTSDDQSQVLKPSNRAVLRRRSIARNRPADISHARALAGKLLGVHC